MDIDKIVAEVLKRIEERLSEEMQEEENINGERVLVISRLYHQGCHPLQNMESLKGDYIFDYAVNSKYQNCIDDYKLVVVTDLDNNSLSKLSSGIFDTPYLALIHKAILMGKEILLAKESLEFYEHRDTEPVTFFNFFQDKVKVLEGWGINVSSDEEILADLKARLNTSHFNKEVRGKDLRKRVVTESDIKETMNERQTSITVLPRTIITDIAKECAVKNGIDIFVYEE